MSGLRGCDASSGFKAASLREDSIPQAPVPPLPVQILDTRKALSTPAGQTPEVRLQRGFADREKAAQQGLNGTN